jgi:hypothetical protein
MVRPAIDSEISMSFVRAFIAGFLATVIFHQGAIALLHVAGVIPFAAWSLEPTWPLRVPAVISLAFWGGVWGLVLWLFLRPRRGSAYWLTALAVGAVGPTAVALLVVFPLKGIEAGADAAIVGGLLNGVWGLGTAALVAPLRRLLPGR